EQPGLPFVVMHTPSGEEAERITGLVSADVFLEMLQGVH
ncbi:MAG: thiol:disulfide interchange protein, partial [Polyangiales bacterium]